ncbi:glycosyltransferase family A protein [Chromobacterium paludis]|uniref:Glycosyltransferase family 2 protein n=1 Tax=Chromobacterium paludis TaxID=2605945 RepID=A0A5C1DM08_9NEIS|nr:glycosyltransferase family 2 protein [Chromobacterium paludis]QEL57704.1 glycosyltransferase family 2 protein [Chromobacterium paludis]
MADIQFYILSRDRPKYIEQTIQSVLDEGYDNVEVIVSDNSLGCEVQLLISERFPQVKYIKRLDLPSRDHFNLVIKEASSEFLVMFHDDDMVLPGYLEVLHGALIKNTKASAVACNSYVVDEGGIITREFIATEMGPRKIETPKILAQEYLRIFTGSHPPFPTYMYRTSMVKECILNDDLGGKHSDLSFLLQVLANGELIWLSHILAKYRVHNSSDSSKESLADRKRILNFLLSSKLITKNNLDYHEYKVYSELRWHYCYWKKGKRRTLNYWRAAQGSIWRLCNLLINRPKIISTLYKKVTYVLRLQSFQ